MKNLIVFPVNSDSNILIKNKDKLHNYNLVVFKQPYDNLTENYYDKLVINNFDEALEIADSILFCDNIIGLQLEYYMEIISRAINKNRELIFCQEIYSKLEDYIKSIKYNNIKILDEEMVYDDSILSHYKKIKNIDVPVIKIFGFENNSSKFELQTKFKNFFDTKGYNCLHISSNSLSKMLNSYVIPSKLFTNEYSFEEKVFLFNDYVYQLCNKVDPDVVLIGIPGGIMPRNKYISNYFGEFASIISNAVQGDINILNVDYGMDITNEYISNLKTFMINKYDSDIDAIGISSQKKGFNFEEKSVETYFLDETYLKKHGQEYDLEIPVFNVWENDKIESVFSELVSVLEENIYLI